MGFHAARLRRALPLCSSLIHGNLLTPKSIPPIRSIAATISAASNPSTAGTSPLAGIQSFRMFRSSPVSLSSRRQRYDNEIEISEDTILFEGCDYNHWLITVDFPKDKDIPAVEKIATYERIAAQVFGSIEEAKKKIYACSTTVYEGFQVLCSEDVSKKFEDIPEVVFVLPDSYIDPVNKQYGGDKYNNGEIIHMPPPVTYQRRDSPRQRYDNQGYDNRGRRDYGQPSQRQNYSPPQNIPHQQQQNFAHQQNVPPQQQNFAHQQNVPPQQQNFASPSNVPHQQQNQNFSPPQHSQSQQRNTGPPQNFQNHQNYGTPLNQNFSYPPNPPREQHIGAPQSPSYGQHSGPQRGAVPQQSYDFPQNAPPQQTYPGHVEDQKFSRVG